MDVTIRGKRKRRGLLVWPVGSSFSKSEIYGCLRKDAPTDEQKAEGIGFPSGYCHFPKYGEEYFKQLQGSWYEIGGLKARAEDAEKHVARLEVKNKELRSKLISMEMQ